MADNYKNNNFNNNKDDIDEFFAKFDQPSAPQQRRPSNPAGNRNSSSPAPRRSQPQRPQGQRVQGQRPQSQRPQGQRTTVHRNQGNGTASRNPGAARPAANQNSYNAQSSRASATNMRSGNARRSANPRQGASHNGRDKITNNPHVRNAQHKLEAIEKKAGFGKHGGGGPRKPMPPQSTWKKIVKLGLTAILTLIMGVGVYVGVILVTTSTSNVNTDDIYSMLSQRSTMYDSEGNEIENLYFSEGNRTILEYDEIPEDMVNAIVSIEDKKFWKHSGFNYIRLVGAVKDSIFGGGQISGTSTVTQQLARNVYLSDIKSQRSMSRKITEAYYTIILEKNLSKKQIMEAYLNTISLGFNSYGIEAASQAYFSKDAKDLDTLECASLAALPKSPTSYALVQAIYDGSNPSGLPVISSTDSVTYLYNGEISKDRRDAVLKNMAEEGYISDSARDDALNDDLQNHIKVGVSDSADESSYFTDYAINQLTDDIVSEYGISRADARDMIYTNGLKIYTTMDSDIQNIVEDEFAKDSNYSGIRSVRKDKNNNILTKNGTLMLRPYSYYINDKGEFTLSSDEYKKNADGSLTIYAKKRLDIYDTEVNGQADVSIQFKGMYTQEGNVFYFIESGALSIPQGYTTRDSSGNAVISAKFFKDYPEFFVANGDNLVVSSNNYSIKQKVRQPQAATVVLENSTGEIKAMMGGRGAKGKQLYNRATSARQPGSSIKPIASYGPALQMSYEYAQDNKKMKLNNSDGSDWGDYITAGSVIDDAPVKNNGKAWPKNWYSGYKGQMTLRHAVQQSVNTCSVKTFQQIGAEYSASMLKKEGVTTVDEEGDVNDLNAAALALGGMTNGISPLEMTAAYAIFPNGGVYKTPIAYTKVLNSSDEVLFEKTAEEERVYDEGVAWIMTDILHSVVTEGLGKNARISNQPSGGKTGTTTDKYDLWFVGFTPQYTAGVWMGNDINIKLNDGGSASASFWGNMMSRICADLPTASFREKPSNVKNVNGEYYVDGTYSKTSLTKTGDSADETTASSVVENTTEQITQATTKAPATKPPTTSSSSDHAGGGE